jgi:hypothetical protein
MNTSDNAEPVPVDDLLVSAALRELSSGFDAGCCRPHHASFRAPEGGRPSACPRRVPMYPWARVAGTAAGRQRADRVPAAGGAWGHHRTGTVPAPWEIGRDA